MNYMNFLKKIKSLTKRYKKYIVAVICVAVIAFAVLDAAKNTFNHRLHNFSMDSDESESVQYKPPVPKFIAQMRTSAYLLTGNKTVNGIYIDNDRLIKIPREISPSSIGANVAILEEIAIKFDRVSVIAIPTASTIYKGINQEYEGEYQSMRERLPQIKFMDPKQYFSIKSDEKIYCATDDVITPLGGYYAYLTIGRRMGFLPDPLDKYTIAYSKDRYYGVLSATTGYYNVEKDMDYYYYNDRSAMFSTEYINKNGNHIWNEIIQDRMIDDRKKGIAPWSITTEREGKKENLLLIADKNGLELLPFLEAHYGAVTVVTTECPRDIAVNKINRDYTDVLVAVSEEKLFTESIFSEIKIISGGF